MAIGFIETPRFPDNLSYGSQGGPEYMTGVAVLQSGHEQRRSVWSAPRHAYNASFAIKLEEDVNAVRAFFHSMKGRYYGFRFKDWFDYTSNADGTTVPTDTDEEIGIGDGIEVDFQLIKTYSTGTQDMVRTINKPITGSVVIAIDGTPTPAGWTVDTVTGVVTFGVAPLASEVITAGYQFDVPCRFDIDQLQVSADTYGIRSADIPIVEVRI